MLSEDALRCKPRHGVAHLRVRELLVLEEVAVGLVKNTWLPSLALRAERRARRVKPWDRALALARLSR